MINSINDGLLLMIWSATYRYMSVICSNITNIPITNRLYERYDSSLINFKNII